MAIADSKRKYFIGEVLSVSDETAVKIMYYKKNAGNLTPWLTNKRPYLDTVHIKTIIFKLSSKTSVLEKEDTKIKQLLQNLFK